MLQRAQEQPSLEVWIIKRVTNLKEREDRAQVLIAH
jgi:hypothetical protein